MQSQPLRKQPGAAVMQTAQYTLALSRHYWLKSWGFLKIFFHDLLQIMKI